MKAAAADLDIVLIYNVPYRPDFNGVENLWTHAKAEYKARKLGHIMTGLSWNNQHEAEAAIQSIDRETAIKCLERGLTALQNGEPIHVKKEEKIQDKMNRFCA